jgi:hypothetical protein
VSDTHPGVEDEVEHALRLGLATAAQLADRVARARRELGRDAQRRSDHEHRQLEARLRAEGASAAARLSVVERPEWWNHASPQQIVSMYRLAHQWRDDEPHAATAAATVAQQVQDRYGIDVTSPSADANELRAALARAEIDRATANNPAAAVEGADDLATAVASVMRTDRRDSALELAAGEAIGRDQGAETPHAERGAAQEPTESDPAYDTLQRRTAITLQMREAGLPEESIAVAMRADVAHARPAVDAASTTRSAPSSRAGRSGSRGTHGPDRSR